MLVLRCIPSTSSSSRSHVKCLRSELLTLTHSRTHFTRSSAPRRGSVGARHLLAATPTVRPEAGVASPAPLHPRRELLHQKKVTFVPLRQHAHNQPRGNRSPLFAHQPSFTIIQFAPAAAAAAQSPFSNLLFPERATHFTKQPARMHVTRLFFIELSAGPASASVAALTPWQTRVGSC